MALVHMYISKLTRTVDATLGKESEGVIRPDGVDSVDGVDRTHAGGKRHHHCTHLSEHAANSAWSDVDRPSTCSRQQWTQLLWRMMGAVPSECDLSMLDAAGSDPHRARQFGYCQRIGEMIKQQGFRWPKLRGSTGVRSTFCTLHHRR